MVVSACKDKFRRFLETFADEAEEDERVENMDDSEPLYMQKLREVRVAMRTLREAGGEVVTGYRLQDEGDQD